MYHIQGLEVSAGDLMPAIKLWPSGSLSVGEALNFIHEEIRNAEYASQKELQPTVFATPDCLG